MKLSEFFDNYEIVDNEISNSLIHHSESIFDVYERLFLGIIISNFLEKKGFIDYFIKYDFDRKELNNLLNRYIEKKLKLGEMEWKLKI